MKHLELEEAIEFCGEGEQGFELICENCSFVYNALQGTIHNEKRELLESIECLDCKIVSYVKVREPLEYKSVPIEQSFFQKLFRKEIKYKTIEIPKTRIPFENLVCPCCTGKNIVKWDGLCLACDGKMKIVHTSL